MWLAHMVQRAKEMVRKIPTVLLEKALFVLITIETCFFLSLIDFILPTGDLLLFLALLEQQASPSTFSSSRYPPTYRCTKTSATIERIALATYLIFLKKEKEHDDLFSDLICTSAFSIEKFFIITGFWWTLTVCEGTVWWKNVSATWRVEINIPWLTLISSITSKLGEFE